MSREDLNGLGSLNLSSPLVTENKPTSAFCSPHPLLDSHVAVQVNTGSPLPTQTLWDSASMLEMSCAQTSGFHFFFFFFEDDQWWFANFPLCQVRELKSTTPHYYHHHIRMDVGISKVLKVHNPIKSCKMNKFRFMQILLCSPHFSHSASF